MQVKNEEFYRNIGFRYENEEDFNREFVLAKAFFEIYPGATKIRKKDGGDFDWPRVLSILNEHRPDLVPDLHMALRAVPKHSYINQVSAENPRERIVLALGSKLADGHCGRIKHSINEYGKHLVQKIETTNCSGQQLEATFNRIIGLLYGEKMHRNCGVRSEQSKYYTSFPHLGVDLFDRLCRDELLDFIYIIKVARKTAWQLHRLHCGDNKTNTPIAHCDIKPENIMLADNGHVEIVDYGMSKTLDMEVLFEGSFEYLPIDNNVLLFGNIDLQMVTLENMKSLGLIGTDIAAFKKSFSALLVSSNNWDLLNLKLREIFHSSLSNIMARREVDTALNITIALIEQEMKLDPMSLSDLNDKQKQLICHIFAKLDKLEELSFGNDDNNTVMQIVNTFREEMVSSTKTETQLMTYLENAEGLLRDYQDSKLHVSRSLDRLGLFSSSQVNPQKDNHVTSLQFK